MKPHGSSRQPIQKRERHPRLTAGSTRCLLGAPNILLHFKAGAFNMDLSNCAPPRNCVRVQMFTMLIYSGVLV